MSEGRVELAERKKLLLARSNLHRLQLQHHAQELQRSLTRPAQILAIATSWPVRPILVSAAVGLAGYLFRLVRGRRARPRSR